MGLTVILNPSSGAKRASHFFENILAPFLKSAGVSFDLLETKSDGDGERLGRLLRSRWEANHEERRDQETKLVCAVLGGDGTSHELITGFFQDLLRPLRLIENRTRPHLELIPIPLGTANALYNHLHSSLSSASPIPPSLSPHIPPIASPEDKWSLQSLFAYLTPSKPNLLPLPLQKTSLYAPNSSEPTHTFLTHIITSTALHASLLHISESLRASHPGLDRFKLAADKVIHVEFKAELTLLSSPNQPIERYAPAKRQFVPHPPESLQGPWAYCLSSTLVTRLEPGFVIAPLLERIPPDQEADATLDLVLMRPGRGKAVGLLEIGEERRIQWENRVRNALGGAYKGGKHVDEILQDPMYPDTEGELEGEVEIYRCSGWEWAPAPSTDEELAHLACADGAIHRIPKGGRAVCEVVGGTETLVSVWK